MGDSNRYRKGLWRWLGFVADFVSSATGGAPAGFTTDMPAEAPDKTRGTGKDRDGQGPERDDPEPTKGTGAQEPKKPSA
jgi:hypothetical protein